VADSLQDQLRKAGLVNDKKLKKAQRQQHAAAMERKTQGVADESLQQAQRARAEKAARDRKLNEQRDHQAMARAIAAQVVQLITQSKQRRDGGDVAFNFVDGRQVKKILVTKLQQDHLSRGRLAIVRVADGYELVPRAIAEKIRSRLPETVVVCNDAEAQPSADDPYADYQIPDDLDW